MIQSRFVRRAAPLATRQFAQMQSVKPNYQDMAKSKHQFVAFVNQASLNKKSGEASELYEFLVQCFVDNDTDYDGCVSFRGFNNMVAQAALAPRRFGFAPHTRELYDTAEQYEQARKDLYNALRGTEERVTLENWVKWADAHISEKVGGGLQEHTEARWERSKADYISFLKGVMAAKSSHCAKSSTSTQLKEHYMNSVRQFTAADVNNTGKLDASCFATLMENCQKVPAKHGIKLYDDIKMSDVTDTDVVTMKQFLDFKVAYLEKKLPTL